MNDSDMQEVRPLILLVSDDLMMGSRVKEGVRLRGMPSRRRLRKRQC
jgi:hypothetical protein